MASDPPAEHIAIRCDLFEVRKLAEWLKARCRDAELSPEVLIELELALVEAANNIVEHGGLGPDDTIRFGCRITPDSVAMTLSDRGSPHPGDLYADPHAAPLDATRSRGVAVILACVDDVHYVRHDGWNLFTLTKRL